MANNQNFVKQISKPIIQNNDSINISIFKEYERVIIQSLITSFGLDMFIRDQHGGDVDTIYNVRKIGDDSEMTYKNKSNEDDYNNRGKYDQKTYHNDKRFTEFKSKEKRKAKEMWNSFSGNPYNRIDGIEDQYTGKKISFANIKSLSKERKAELDHVIECKAIHDDRGRVLAGLKGEDLANNPDNFAWTNKGLNSSMGAWGRDKSGPNAPMEKASMKAYVEKHPNLDEETKQRMLKHYEKSSKIYERRVNVEYYTSKKFFIDTSKAALKIGAKMGLRQAFGFVFSEIWFAVRDEFHKAKSNVESLLRAIGNGIKKGLENAKQQYRQIWDLFIQGSIAGLLSSLTTTLCNIFFTTAKNIVRIVRQSWASIVEATKIIIFNPNYLPLGERLRAGAKILATGASVVTGTLISEFISGTAIGTIPFIGEIIQTFCGTLLSGILSCTLLYVLDHSSNINSLVNIINKIKTVDDIEHIYVLQGEILEEYCAKLMSIDIGKFKEQVASYCMATILLESASNENDLQKALNKVYMQFHIPSPFGKHHDFDDFMNDPNAVLTFK